MATDHLKDIWRRNRQKHREERNEYNRNYYKEHKKYFYEKNKEYRTETKIEKKKEYMKRYREKNAERLKKQKQEYDKKYREENSERRCQNSKNYRARKIVNGGTISEIEWKNLCNKYGNKCLCCGKVDVKLTLDHVIPLKLGGKHSIDNAQPLCRNCNSRKNARYIDYRENYNG